MKKIVVTGGCGFIGSHLCELLVQKGFKVVAFDRYNINNDLGWLKKSKFRKDIEFILGDIRDFESVNSALKNCNYVFHLAALIGIPYSYSNPLAYIKTNIEGTYNVLSASKMNNLDQIIITSTSEVYGSAQYTPIDENHPCVGQSPYSASKISADQLAISFYKSFNLPIKIARPFNTYGPRQSERAIIPTIIKQCLMKKRINLGNQFPTRDLTYVDDTCLGFYEIFKEKEFFGEIVNIGSGKEISIKDLKEKILKKMNKRIDTKIDKKRVRPRNSEVDKLICNNEKIMKKTKWKIENDLDKGLDKTINWFKKNKHVFDTDIDNFVI